MGEFSRWLRAFIESREDIDQNALAKLMGVSQSTISFWINERSQPRDRNVWKLSEITGVPIRQIYVMMGKPMPDPNGVEGVVGAPANPEAPAADDMIIPPELVPFFKPIVDGLARLRDTPTFEYAVRGVTAMLETMIEQIEEEKKKTKT